MPSASLLTVWAGSMIVALAATGGLARVSLLLVALRLPFRRAGEHSPIRSAS
jgi:hypothetical protein